MKKICKRRHVSTSNRIVSSTSLQTINSWQIHEKYAILWKISDIWRPSWIYANEENVKLPRRLSQMIACIQTPDNIILDQLNIQTESKDITIYVNM